MRVAERHQQFRQFPVGTDGAEDLLVLDLSGHDGLGDALALESFDQLAELAEGEPVDRSGPVLLDLGRSLLLDGRYDDFGAVGAGGVKDEERELTVAGDEAEFLFGFEHCRNCVSLLNNARARRPHDCRRDAGATA